jgi:phosphoribosylformimino-5-aminoimidazole carboxamide ribotide isomerase
MEVIPAMDLLGGRVVRLHQGDYARVTVYADDPAEMLAAFVDAGARRVHLVDLDGARDGAATQGALLAGLVARFGHALRVQVGGGVRTLDQARAYRDAGADRVVVGTRAVEDPDFVAQCAEFVPVVVALDARDGRVATRGWTTLTDRTAVDLARSLAALGATAVLYTDIARDGTGAGPNVEATARLAEAVPGVEVIASGGIGSLDHLRALAAAPAIAATVVGRALYERAFTVAEALAAGRGGVQL